MRILLLYFLIFLSASAYSQSEIRQKGSIPVEQYIESANKIDINIAVKQNALLSAQKTVDFYYNKSNFIFSLGTGESSYVGKGKGGIPDKITTAPWFKFNVPSPANVELEASVPISSTLDGQMTTISPQLSLKHKLDDLIYKKPDIALLRAAFALSNAEKALNDAKIELAIKVLSALRDWAQAENELETALFSYEVASKRHKEALLLKEYGTQSLLFKRLQNAELTAELTVQRAKKNLERKRSIVAVLCGMEPDEKPPIPFAVARPNFEAITAKDSYSLDLAYRSFELSKLSFEAEWGKKNPSLFWNTSIAGRLENQANQKSNSFTASIGLGLDFENISASTSFAWNSLYNQPSVLFNLAWTPGDTKSRDHKKDIALASLAEESIQVKGKELAAQAELKDMMLEVEFIDIELKRLEAAYAEAVSAVSESTELFAKGLINKVELDKENNNKYNTAAMLETAQWNKLISWLRISLQWRQM